MVTVFVSDNKEDLIVGIVVYKLKLMGNDSPAAGRDE